MGVGPATFNYSVGAIDEAPPLTGSDVPRKNYFTFDLSSVSSPIVGAELRLFNPVGGFSSPEPTETYSLGGTIAAGPGDMTAFAASLTMPWSIFVPAELATALGLYGRIADVPMSFGDITVSSADDGTIVIVPLNSFGISYLNTYLGGKVVLGGSLSTLNGSLGPDEVMFGFTAPLIPGVVSPDPIIPSPTPIPLLALTVSIPEPTTLLLSAVSIVIGTGILLYRRRRDSIEQNACLSG
jgi:hypothetical protein